MLTLEPSDREGVTVDGLPTLHELPRLSAQQWSSLSERARAERAPLMGAGLAQREGVDAWTLERFVEVFGDRKVPVAVRLPERGKPYAIHDDSSYVEMPVRELALRIESGEPCYLHQARLDDFDEFARDLSLAGLIVLPLFGANLWIGNGTSSGLHFDSADNLFVQLQGEKTVILVDPRHTSSLAAFPDTPSKSRIDPNCLTPKAHRTLARVPLWRSRLLPGDVLYIPRGWWHQVTSPGASISVNVWHGARLNSKDQLEAFMRAGPRAWGRVAWDFTWSGLLHQPYRQRMFSPPPLGVDLFDRLRKGTRRLVARN